MKRLMSLAMIFGVVVSVFAQEEGEAAKPARFESLVRIADLSKPEALTVKRPGADAATQAQVFKAYPYGSTFTLEKGATCRVYFSDMTYTVILGPATFTPEASDEWKKVDMKVQRGTYNVSVHASVLPDQFSVTTPLGTFAEMQGMSRVHVGDIKDGVVTTDDFSFRVLSGTAKFKGLHYAMSEMTQANYFTEANASGMTTSDIKGRVGEVKMDIPTSGDGKTMPFSLTPGTTVKITRAKAKGSNNWTVSVLTFFANGEAQNYFCYVENRGEGYYTGELIAEILPEEEEGEEGEEDADDSETYTSEPEDTPDEMESFDEYDLM